MGPIVVSNVAIGLGMMIVRKEECRVAAAARPLSDSRGSDEGQKVGPNPTCKFSDGRRRHLVLAPSAFCSKPGMADPVLIKEPAAEVLAAAASPPKSPPEGGVFPSKQQQNDEATAPLDDQERRAVARRMQRKSEERKAEMLASGGGALSVRAAPQSRDHFGTGAYTPKGSWLSGRLTGRRTARGGSSSSGFGFLSSRTAQSTARSMMSTSRSMMTTARSDVATGRYNDFDAEPDMTENRVLEMSRLANELPEGEEAPRTRRPGAGTTARTGKTPRKTSNVTAAASLRAGLIARSKRLQQATRGRTPRTGRMHTMHPPPRQPGERPTHGG